MDKKIIIISLFIFCVGALLFIFQNNNKEISSSASHEEVNIENIKPNEKKEDVEDVPPSENIEPSEKVVISSDNKDNSKVEASQIIKESRLDKIEVFLFHNTQRCISCVNIGKFAKKTIDDNFSEELNSGKIVFREINLDLPENYQLAEKFQASGSSLYVNTIIGGKDSIEQDLRVWRLVGNEAEFESYFKGKIENILKS